MWFSFCGSCSAMCWPMRMRMPMRLRSDYSSSSLKPNSFPPGASSLRGCWEGGAFQVGAAQNLVDLDSEGAPMWFSFCGSCSAMCWPMRMRMPMRLR